MSKKFFRFLRGELNGFYLQAIYNVSNVWVKPLVDFIIEWNNMQFDMSMPEKDIRGLGKFAGAYLPIFDITYRLAFHMTESAVYDGVQRSERGLYNTNLEKIEFYHTEYDDYPEDINTLANQSLKSSMVGDDETVIGYISSTEEDIFLADGTVDPNKILSEPPSGVAYTEFYGDKFTFLLETDTSVENTLELELYLQLVEVLQLLKTKDVNLESLCDLISIICPNGLVKITSIEPHTSGRYLIVNYQVDLTADVSLRERRLDVLLYIVKLKFLRIILNEEV